MNGLYSIFYIGKLLKMTSFLLRYFQMLSLLQIEFFLCSTLESGFLEYKHKKIF